MRGELLEAERVHSIVGAFFSVYNYYGYGLNEAIYSRRADAQQLQPYLHATTFEVGVLPHFGPSPKFHRFIDFPKAPRP